MTEFQQAIQRAQNALQQRRPAEAKRHFRVALGVLSDASQVAPIEELTRVLHQSGEFLAAAAGYEVVMRISGVSAAHFHNLGLAHYSLGNFSQAASCFERAAELDRRDPETLVHLGNALRESQQNQAALQAYQNALAILPTCFNAYLNMGIAYRQANQIDEALSCYEQAMRLQPNHAHLRYCMARAYQAAGQTRDFLEALQYCLRLAPDYAAARNALGNHLQSQGQWQAAAEQYQQLLRRQPKDYRGWNNLGTALRKLGNNAEAISCLRRAAELAPEVARTHANLGQALRDTGQLDQAQRAYTRAVELEPKNWELLGNLLYLQQRLCDWSKLTQRAELLEQACAANDFQQAAPHPLAIISLPEATTAAQQLQVARAWGAQYPSQNSDSAKTRGRAAKAAGHSKIRVGYLSADFYDHPVAALISEIFELHDRERFEIFAYSIGAADSSSIRQRIVQAADCFRDEYASSFRETAARIEADEIDVMVDLMGYTKASRTQILACRPAAIQVNYLGYPGTMGVDYIDYIIADSHVIPADAQACYSESVVTLPDCYLPCDSQRKRLIEEVSRQQFQIPEKALLLCSFVNSYKITPEVFDTWMRLMREVPDSLLWLSSHNSWVVNHLREEAEARGVASQRLLFSERLPLGKHLGRHRVADLFLDTYPYNGHTTASDALRCGLPLVTLQGKSFASRVAASLLNALGFPQLIANDLEEYHSICLQLATDPDYRLDLRRQLEAAVKTSSAFDSKMITRRLEAAYRQMYGAYRRGASPQPISVTDE